jgi:hypothetical protein
LTSAAGRGPRRRDSPCPGGRRPAPRHPDNVERVERRTSRTRRRTCVGPHTVGQAPAVPGGSRRTSSRRRAERQPRGSTPSSPPTGRPGRNPASPTLVPQLRALSTALDTPPDSVNRGGRCGSRVQPFRPGSRMHNPFSPWPLRRISRKRVGARLLAPFLLTNLMPVLAALGWGFAPGTRGQERLTQFVAELMGPSPHRYRPADA